MDFASQIAGMATVRGEKQAAASFPVKGKVVGQTSNEDIAGTTRHTLSSDGSGGAMTSLDSEVEYASNLASGSTDTASGEQQQQGGGGSSSSSATVREPRRKKSLLEKLFPTTTKKETDDGALAGGATKSFDSDGMSEDETIASSSSKASSSGKATLSSGSKAADLKGDGIRDKIKSLYHKMEKVEREEPGLTNAAAKQQIQALQQEIQLLNYELETYKSEKHTLVNMSKKPSVYVHQKTKLTHETFDTFFFKGVITVHNEIGQTVDSFDLFPDTTTLKLPAHMKWSPPKMSPQAQTRFRRASSPPPRPNIDALDSLIVASTASPSAEKPSGTLKGTRANTSESHRGHASSPSPPLAQLTSVGGSNPSPPPPSTTGEPGRPSTPDKLVAREWANRMAVHRKLTQKEIKGDTAFIEHSIHEVNLVLDTASSLTKIKEPHKVNMFYYLREDSQRRYDCIACITLNVPNIRAEMLDKIRRSLQRATDNGLVPLESNPAVSVTALAFELIDYCENIEIRTLINVGIGSTGEAIPIIVRFDITIPIPATPKAETSTSPKTSIPPPSSSATAPSSSSSSGAVTVQLKSLNVTAPQPPANASHQPQQPPSSSTESLGQVFEPVLTTKTIQNFWFRVEIEYDDGWLDDRPTVLGPFFPAEQHIVLADSHYYIEQDFILSDVSVLTPQRRLEKRSPYDTVFHILYYCRDRVSDDTSMFCVADFEILMAEIIKGSQGFQKERDRFKVEKQMELGQVHAVFHFFVADEVVPEPSTTGQAINPTEGNWELERITLRVRVQ